MLTLNCSFGLIPTFIFISLALNACAVSRVSPVEMSSCEDAPNGCSEDIGRPTQGHSDTGVNDSSLQDMSDTQPGDMQIVIPGDGSILPAEDMSTSFAEDATLPDDATIQSVDASPPSCQQAGCPNVPNGANVCVDMACELNCDEFFALTDERCTDIDECRVDHGGCGAESHYGCLNIVGAPPRCTALFGTNRVLFIGLDGTRGSVMNHPSVLTPNLDFLKSEGLYSDRVQTGDVSVSGPGWSNNLTGVWRDKHNVSNNTVRTNRYGTAPYINGADFPDFIGRLESLNSNYVTGWINSWDQLELMAGRNAADHHFYQQYNVNGDFDSVEQGRNMLTSFDMHAMFFYFAMIDIAGHRHGFHRTIDEYVSAIERVDLQIGQLLNAVQSRPDYEHENWLIVVTTDHGGSSGSLTSHGENAPYDRTGFVILNGNKAVTRTAQGGRVYPHPHQVDVAPSIYAHLGVQVDPRWGLDGQSILNEGVKAPAAFGINLIENADAEAERGFTDMDFDGPITGWEENYGGVLITYDAPTYPLSSAHPTGGSNFFSGGTDKSSSMIQTIDVTNLNLSATSQYALSAEIGGYRDQDDRATVNVRFLNNDESATLRWDDDTAYFFKGTQYRAYDIVSDTAVGLARDIATDWPGLNRFEGGAQNIEAAFNNGAGKAYFFKGDAYIRFTIATRTVDSGYPRSIQANWSGLDGFEGGAQNLDAAFSDGDVVYFFKAKEYIRFDLGDDQTDARYPRDISQLTWEGLHVWSGRIDAALKWTNNRVQFFKEGAYIRFDMTLDRASDGYPRLVSRDTWPNLSEWESLRRLVTLDAVTADDRSNQTRLLSRRQNGVIPVGTTSIEVELLFTVSTGKSDGYVDHISLVLTQ